MQAQSATADQILAISEPEKLFPIDRESAKAVLRTFAKRFHPDQGSERNSDVMSHINALYSEAEKKRNGGLWVSDTSVTLAGHDGKVRNIFFKIKRPIEIGQMMYGPNVVSFMIDTNYADLFHNAEREISRLHYEDAAMKKNVEPLMPSIMAKFETKTGHSVMVMRKPAGTYAMRDVLGALGGKMDARHVAWCVSRMLNITAYLQYAKITHNDISLDSVFISPADHSAFLFGGWWWSRPIGAKLAVLPSRSDQHLPFLMRQQKAHDTTLDFELVRATALELLGDPTGSTLTKEDAPKPMLDYFRMPPPNATIGWHLQHWKKKVLTDSFGARRFVELVVPESDIFK